MTWPHARKSVAVFAIVLLGVVIALVAMNFSAATGPTNRAAGSQSTGSAGSAGSAADAPRPATAGSQQKALVERVIAGLKGGKKVRSFDNPAAGAVLPAVETASNVPVGRLSIARMELRTPFFEGVYDSVIDSGPGHWPGTPLPGQPGNAVVSGHRATHGAEFVDIDDLEPGDEIETQVGGSTDAVTYVVQGTTIVREENYVDFVLQQPKNPDARVLTLFACNPEWASTHRIVVRAEAAPASAETGG